MLSCAYLSLFLNCFVTAGDKEDRISTRQSQSGKSLPSKSSTSMGTSTLSKGSGTDTTSGMYYVTLFFLAYLF